MSAATAALTGPRVAGGTRAEFFPLASAAIFVFLLVTWVLPLPLPIQPDHYLLDHSWQIALTRAFLDGAQFGRDFIYTYGPWGFLDIARGDPRIYPWLTAGRLLLAAAFSIGLARIAQKYIQHPLARILFIAWIAVIADPVFVLPVLLLIVFHEEKRPAMIHVIAVACGLTLWIKFTCFVAVAGLGVALAAQDSLKRRFPIVSAEICGAGAAFWLLGRQSPFGIGAFLHGALSTAVSYSHVMFMDGPAWEGEIVGLLIVAAAILLGLQFLKKPVWALTPAILWASLAVFLELKEGFVRHDSFHIWMGIVNAVIPTVLILAVSSKCFEVQERILRRVAAMFVIFLSVAFPALQTMSPAGQERVQFAALNARGLADMLRGQSGSDQYRTQIEDFTMRRPLPHVPGTAGLFPDSQAMLYGNGLNASLSPVPQAFSAYNEYLSGLNAGFYRSARRPDYLFFDVFPIDERYPTASDGLSWLALLDCYRPEREAGGYLLLKASGCAANALQPLSETVTRAGESIPVPDAGAQIVWVQFDMSLNAAGSLLATIAKPPLTQISIASASGHRTFRISPETGRTGFLLSPFIGDRKAFAHLFERGSERENVNAMKIVIANEDRRWFKPEIRVRFFRKNLAQ